ncbi:MAG TPA: hypothetical protein VNB22_06850 [Pyrinomonadaceae bacterium]|nr:hypothetical protein [Pyrinomonadaceae bacterium]
MKNQYGFRKLNIIIIVLAVFGATAIQANANVKIDRYKTAIVQKLTEKLRFDLSDQTVEVKLNDVRDNEISKNQVDFDGKALAVVINDKTELPFQFTAQVNLAKQSIENIDYKFVEGATEFAPSLAEDSLMKGLMTQISKDYDTTNIVISIDGFDAAKLTSEQTKYEGTGEVRIGDFEWRKIKFNVVLDSQSQTATKILYDVQK